MNRNEKFILELNQVWANSGDPSRLSPFRKGYDAMVLNGSTFSAKSLFTTENEEMGRAVAMRLEMKPVNGGIEGITNYYDIAGLDIRVTLSVGAVKIADNIPIREVASYIPVCVEYNSKFEIYVEATPITGSGITEIETALVFIPVMLYSRHHMSFVKNPSILVKNT
jgi:hypothetical protein